jgi:hypothetical protein
MKKIFWLLTVLYPFNFCVAQNIGINSTGAAPVASAMLDILATDKGLLIPRVALTATNAAGPVQALPPVYWCTIPLRLAHRQTT